ncbi:MAG: glucosaminidase domain-containing protein [Saprospiraceae bacterium]|nr:glucosaminidase domain-containing protein [Saprospiraceae bacterium]
MRNSILAAFAVAAIVLSIGAVAPDYLPNSPNEPNKIEEYILRFKDLAMLQQLTTNIPASIKLGQAVYESQAGESELAMNANNHFGLKCRTCSGDNIYWKKDDEYNKKGELMYSKFERFPSAEASFFAHSERLTTDGRYRSLFNNDRTDYQSWAYGLKKCGYATDKQYAEKLIAIIERYGLHRFDKPSLLSLSEVAQTTPPKYAAEQTAVNVPYDSDPNVPSPRYNLQENVQRDVEENVQNNAAETNRRKQSKTQKMTNTYRAESEFVTKEGEQMHFTLYEVTVEEDKDSVKPESVYSKNIPQKQPKVAPRTPTQRKKIVRHQQ